MALKVEEAPARRFWNVPNSLTVGRLGLALVVFWCIGRRHDLAALVVFILAALTDALDGYFARLLGQASTLGRQLDPLVDKVIIAGSLIYLLPIDGTGLAPWMVAAIVIRELIVQALRSLIEGLGEPFGARWAGKLKMAFQCIAIAAILIGLQIEPSSAWLWLRDAFTWTAVVLTIYSGLGYLLLAWKKLKTTL